jgi:hypothetical protein
VCESASAGAASSLHAEVTCRGVRSLAARRGTARRGPGLARPGLRRGGHSAAAPCLAISCERTNVALAEPCSRRSKRRGAPAPRRPAGPAGGAGCPTTRRPGGLPRHAVAAWPGRFASVVLAAALGTPTRVTPTLWVSRRRTYGSRPSSVVPRLGMPGPSVVVEPPPDGYRCSPSPRKRAGHGSSGASLARIACSCWGTARRPE